MKITIYLRLFQTEDGIVTSIGIIKRGCNILQPHIFGWQQIAIGNIFTYN